MKELIAAGKRGQIKMGVYASEHMWGIIMGEGCHVAAKEGLELWYTDWDNEPSFGGFQPFGGWRHPAVKQYSDSVRPYNSMFNTTHSICVSTLLVISSGILVAQLSLSLGIGRPI